MNKISCEICGIKTCRLENQKRMFMAKFPLRDEERCKQWVKATGIEDLVYIPIEKLHQLKYVCGKHFRPSDFKKKKTQLRKNSVPSLFLMRPPLPDELLIGFPMHINQSNKNQNMTLKVMDHNYCVKTRTKHDWQFENNEKYEYSLGKSFVILDDEEDSCSSVNDNVVLLEEENDINDSSGSQEGDEIEGQASLNGSPLPVHSDFTCNICYGGIVGFRYTCLQCADWDMCAACEARGAHPHHYVLRLPAPPEHMESARILTTIREQVQELLRSRDEMVTDVYIKEEFLDEELLETASNQAWEDSGVPDLDSLLDRSTPKEKMLDESHIKQEFSSSVQLNELAKIIKSNSGKNKLSLKLKLKKNYSFANKGLNKNTNRATLRLVLKPAIAATCGEKTVFSGNINKNNQTLSLTKSVVNCSNSALRKDI